MTPDSFATSALRVTDRFKAWCEWYRTVLDMTPLQPTDRGFEAEICVWRAGRFAQTLLRRLAVSPNFRKHELVVLHDHPGAGRDLSQPWAPAFAGVDFNKTMTYIHGPIEWAKSG